MPESPTAPTTSSHRLPFPDSPDHVSALSSIYKEACKKHGVLPDIEVQNAISKEKSGILKLNMGSLTEEEILSLADVFCQLENSELHAIDVVHNKRTSSGHTLLRALRSIGSKLRVVDFRKVTLGRDVMRDLFHRGLQCYVLDLSFSRFRKLDMMGHFPHLHTLILDFSMHLTILPEGCFRATPNLARLSMCGTWIANLWTTCAVLSKIPTLTELSFQRCRCCEGTSSCSSVSTTEISCLEDITPMRDLANIWRMNKHSMDIDDFGLLDSEGTDSSNSDGYDNENLFSDDDSAMMLHPVQNTSSEDSSEDSEPELEGNTLEAMSVEDDDYKGDEDEDAVDPQELINDDQGRKGYNDQFADAAVSGDVEDSYNSSACPDYYSTEGESSTELVTSVRRSESRNDALSPGAAPEASTQSRDGRQMMFSTNMQNRSVLFRHGRFHHISRICYEKYYREFIIARLPGLKVLDNIPLTQEAREKAFSVFVEHFEILPNKCSEGESIVDVLQDREILNWKSPYPSTKRRRVGISGSSSTGAALTRSACALKMSSCAWPSCVPICKDKGSSIELNRKCRPRQFEYHPTDPSLMVFGTLHGEVVVINHESDKVVGHVQSNGSTHSILGLCWLNKDPNKLIAGSDDGSLQLYDVNRMRAIKTPRQIRRNPAIYTYESFDQLTSVHINCADEYFLASGYSRNVGLYDLCTGKQLHIFTDLHQQHINVVKFAHHSPYLFATSSFDKEIKMWDLRQRAGRPLYTVKSNGGNVMVCFSRDDYYLLSSAVDNEVRQHLAVDGRLHMKLDIPPSGSNQNYTRSYYMNGRDYIISGSCEENVVRIYSAQTGRRLRDLALEGRCSRNSIYVQSLRGDPFRDFHFSVLAAYFQPHPKSEILKVNLLASNMHCRGADTDSQYKLPAGVGA